MRLDPCPYGTSKFYDQEDKIININTNIYLDINVSYEKYIQ